MAYDVHMNQLVLYTTSTCQYCWEMREYLRATHIPFFEKQIDLAPEAALEVAALVGDQVVPVVAIMTETAPKVVIGLDKQRLQMYYRR